MPELNLLSLRCLVPQDRQAIEIDLDLKVFDEAYLVVNGNRVWGVKRMTTDDVEDLSNLPPIAFSDRVRIDMYDRDTSGGPFSSDDHLGGVDVTEDKVGEGVQSHDFTERGAKYTLKYEVK